MEYIGEELRPSAAEEDHFEVVSVLKMPSRRSVVTVGVHWQRKDADLQGPAQLLVVLVGHINFDPSVLLCIKHDAVFLTHNQDVPIR